MSSSKNTFIAFLLNLSFSIIEFIFGWLFGSSAILADAVHDLGDALAIGSSAIMQTYANKPADRVYPFGYKRWNILVALLTSSILIIGSSLILVENIPNLFHPQPVNQDGMLVLGIIAVIINFLASRIVKMAIAIMSPFSACTFRGYFRMAGGHPCFHHSSIY